MLGDIPVNEQDLVRNDDKSMEEDKWEEEVGKSFLSGGKGEG